MDGDCPVMAAGEAERTPGAGQRQVDAARDAQLHVRPGLLHSQLHLRPRVQCATAGDAPGQRARGCAPDIPHTESVHFPHAVSGQHLRILQLSFLPTSGLFHYQREGSLEIQLHIYTSGPSKGICRSCRRKCWLLCIIWPLAAP